MEANESKYTLKPLQAKDMFPMFRIIKKIGVREFKDCFMSEDVKGAIAKKNGVSIETVGVQIMLDMAVVVIEHIADAEAEIYAFLSGLSGLSKSELEDLGFIEFTRMIMDVFKKDEFKDFIGVVSELFN